MTDAPATLAHAYGIPEAITVLVPMAVLAAIIVAGRRRDRAAAESSDEPANDDSHGDVSS